MADKITNLKALEMALVILAKHEDFPAEALEKVTNVKNSYAKKSDKDKEPTERQKENAKLGEAIVAYLSADKTKKFTISQIMKHLNGLALSTEEMSNQRVTRILTDLYDKGNGAIIRTEDKRVIYFSAK